MPELPEMEIYRRRLTQTIIGKPMTAVDVHREKTVNLPPQAFVDRLLGQRILDVSRRGKHLLFHLASGDTLLLHLMLGGWLYYGDPEHQPAHHPQVVCTFSDGRQLFFLGLRLGFLHCLGPAELAERLRDLGPEPLAPDFSLSVLQSRLSRRRGLLKPALVDQHCIAGIGNCYSDEICFQAGILPLTSIPTLDDARVSTLFEAMSPTLERAISYGGYMDFPYTEGDDRTGGYNSHCLVYDRGGEPCPRCGHAITQTEHARRKVFFCPQCQR